MTRGDCPKYLQVLCLLIIVFLIFETQKHVRRSTVNRAVSSPQFNKTQLENNFKEQDHPELLELLRKDWIHFPSDGPLNLVNPQVVDYSQYKQSKMVQDVLKNKTNGFFVECGAFDGESHSNSLFFERQLHWTGLLVEADPSSYAILLKKKRNAFSINSCLNTKNESGKLTFGIHDETGGLKADNAARVKYRSEITTQCFTLYSIMKAIKKNRIDFFSLDIEGAELGVLKTIPFSDLYIDVLLIEYTVHGTSPKSSISMQRYITIDAFMKLNGYKLIVKTSLDLLYKRIKP